VPKKAKKSKKLGSPEVVSNKKLLDRLKALKQFLEDNWGRIGLELQRVGQPGDVRTTLRLVQGVEWWTPFRDHPAACLLHDGNNAVGWRDLRLTRQSYEDAVATESRLWSEYHTAQQRAVEASTALKVVISEFGAAIGFFRFFLVVALLAKTLGVEELTNNSNRLEKSLKESQKQKAALKEQLSSQEAWFARDEIVGFVRSRRYDRTPLNFAKAMAGLPQYRWLHSFRRCSALQDESLSSSTPNYRLFELLRLIVKRTKPLSLKNVETKLREELFRPDADSILKVHIGPNWWYMEQAFAECRGFKRSELPYKIMAKFLDYLERPKTITELELAKLAATRI